VLIESSLIEQITNQNHEIKSRIKTILRGCVKFTVSEDGPFSV